MDLANGSAGFIPYPMINVFPVLPEPMSSLDNYSRWSEFVGSSRDGSHLELSAGAWVYHATENTFLAI